MVKLHTAYLNAMKNVFILHKIVHFSIMIYTRAHVTIKKYLSSFLGNLWNCTFGFFFFVLKHPSYEQTRSCFGIFNAPSLLLVGSYSHCTLLTLNYYKKAKKRRAITVSSCARELYKHATDRLPAHFSDLLSESADSFSNVFK